MTSSIPLIGVSPNPSKSLPMATRDRPATRAMCSTWSAIISTVGSSPTNSGRTGTPLVNDNRRPCQFMLQTPVLDSNRHDNHSHDRFMLSLLLADHLQNIVGKISCMVVHRSSSAVREDDRGFGDGERLSSRVVGCMTQVHHH